MDEIIEENIESNEEMEDLKNKKDLEKIKVIIETQKKDIEEKDDRIKRLMAEFDNFKKRSSKERENLYSSIIETLIKKP